MRTHDPADRFIATITPPPQSFASPVVLLLVEIQAAGQEAFQMSPQTVQDKLKLGKGPLAFSLFFSLMILVFGPETLLQGGSAFQDLRVAHWSWRRHLPRSLNVRIYDIRVACWNLILRYGGFPKLGVPFLGVPIIRTTVYWGPFWGPLI